MWRYVKISLTRCYNIIIKIINYDYMLLVQSNDANSDEDCLLLIVTLNICNSIAMV